MVESQTLRWRYNCILVDSNGTKEWTAVGYLYWNDVRIYWNGTLNGITGKPMKTVGTSWKICFYLLLFNIVRATSHCPALFILLKLTVNVASNCLFNYVHLITTQNIYFQFYVFCNLVENFWTKFVQVAYVLGNTSQFV